MAVEAVKLGAAVVHGPHVFNFTDVYEALDGAGGAKLADTQEALVRQLEGTVQADQAAVQASAARLAAAGRSTHPPRFLLLYGSLRERSYSRLLTFEAARLLLETHTPLKQIADACGFANANHFCKVFRRIQHVSPKAYRRTIR